MSTARVLVVYYTYTRQTQLEAEAMAGSTRTVRKLGTRHGGSYIDGIHFTFAGGQVRSLVALVSYLRTGKMRARLLGVKIPPTNLQPEQILAARSFAHGLANQLAETNA